MRVLAIETATVAVAVALADESGPLSALTVRADRQHAERLHVLVEEALELAGAAFADIDCLAVDVGPGLFTGIRVGVAAAKGFAMALGLPVVALTSLEVIAAACAPAGGAGRAHGVAVVDLRRGEVAWRLPAEAGNGVEVGHGAPAVLARLLSDRFAGHPGDAESVVVAGDGALRYSDVLTAAVPGLRIAGPELAGAPVASLAVLAFTEMAAGRTTSAAGVMPVYLRDADVRINWTTRHDSPGDSPREPPGGAEAE